MTLRIDVVAGADVPTILLHGRLSVAEIAELERTVADAGRPLRIDLGQLVAVDADGRRSLCLLERSGASLVGASPYLAMLLESDERARRAE